MFLCQEILLLNPGIIKEINSNFQELETICHKVSRISTCFQLFLNNFTNRDLFNLIIINKSRGTYYITYRCSIKNLNLSIFLICKAFVQFELFLKSNLLCICLRSCLFEKSLIYFKHLTIGLQMLMQLLRRLNAIIKKAQRNC